MLRRCVGNVFSLSRHPGNVLCNIPIGLDYFRSQIGPCERGSQIEVHWCLWIVRDRFGTISAREANMWRGGCANGDQMRTDKRKSAK